MPALLKQCIYGFGPNKKHKVIQNSTMKIEKRENNNPQVYHVRQNKRAMHELPAQEKVSDPRCLLC